MSDNKKTGTMTMTSAMMGLGEKPWFPVTVTITQANAAITLNADGSWVGDIEAVRAALAEGKGWQNGNDRVLLWLLLREMQRGEAP
jgi:hypothetical protein